MTARHRYEMEDSQRGASRRVGKRERNNCFIKKKNAHKISRVLPDFIFFKTIDFQLVFNCEQTRTVIIFGEHSIMAHIP